MAVGAMGEIGRIDISLEDLRFFGGGFDPEVIYNFIELEIAEIYELEYIWGTSVDDLEYYNFETEPLLRETCQKYKSVYDILAITEDCESRSRLNIVNLRFTNGIAVLYTGIIEGCLNICFDNEKLFYEYLNPILRQYGYIPEKIFSIARWYPNTEVYINRPGEIDWNTMNRCGLPRLQPNIKN